MFRKDPIRFFETVTLGYFPKLGDRHVVVPCQ
jgi:hypothetical protein